mmetsp:Transcript_17028/g.30760  ORF Transcript_17028/g.30760 Transcript_17028/m.30760 type:complete len:169 (+) Transcript_17028:79-585(+)
MVLQSRRILLCTLVAICVTGSTGCDDDHMCMCYKGGRLTTADDTPDVKIHDYMSNDEKSTWRRSLLDCTNRQEIYDFFVAGAPEDMEVPKEGVARPPADGLEQVRACDMLKLTAFCYTSCNVDDKKIKACERTKLTIPDCDVNCNSAVPMGLSPIVIALVMSFFNQRL